VFELPPGSSSFPLHIHHANEEENSIFPKAQEAIGDQAAKELEARFLSAKQQLMASA